MKHLLATTGLFALAFTTPAMAQSANDVLEHPWSLQQINPRMMNGLAEDRMEDGFERLFTPEIEELMDAGDFTGVMTKIEDRVEVGDAAANLLYAIMIYPTGDVRQAYEAMGPNNAPMDAERALKHYSVAAEARFPLALEAIGEIYMDEDSGVYSLDKARKAFKRAIAANPRDTTAHHALGEIFAKEYAAPTYRAEIANMYAKTLNDPAGYSARSLGYALMLGDQVERDIPLGRTLLAPSVAAGEPFALKTMGDVHRLGAGTPVSETEALKFYVRAAELENAEAAMIAAHLIKTGAHPTFAGAEAEKEAFELMLLAAKQGKARAMDAVAEAYEKGKGTQKDKEQAAVWRERAALRVLAFAETFNPDLVLAPEADLAAAIEKAEASQLAEDFEAANILRGSIAIGGPILTVPRERLDTLSARVDNLSYRISYADRILTAPKGDLYEIVKREAAEGNVDAAASLARMHKSFTLNRTGRNLDWIGDYERAIALGSADAMYELGDALRPGQSYGVPPIKKDAERSEALVKQAAEAGHWMAAWRLANPFDARRTAPLSKEEQAERLYYLRLAAEHPRASSARFRIGEIMVKGELGLEQDIKGGLEQMKQAALERWNAKSFYSLADIIYEVQGDGDAALEYIDLAEAVANPEWDYRLIKQIDGLREDIAEGER